MLIERFTICLIVTFECVNISLLAATSLAATSVVWSMTFIFCKSIQELLPQQSITLFPLPRWYFRICSQSVYACAGRHDP